MCLRFKICSANFDEIIIAFKTDMLEIFIDPSVNTKYISFSIAIY